MTIDSLCFHRSKSPSHFHHPLTQQAFEPRTLYHRALECSKGKWPFDVNRVLLSDTKGRCVVKVPILADDASSTDLVPPYRAECAADIKTKGAVPRLRGDEAVTGRVHVLRVATAGMEDATLRGFEGLFKGAGVGHAVSTVSPSSLKGVKAFFAKVKGKVCWCFL